MTIKAWEYKKAENCNHLREINDTKLTCDRYGHVISNHGLNRRYRPPSEEFDYQLAEKFANAANRSNTSGSAN